MKHTVEGFIKINDVHSLNGYDSTKHKLLLCPVIEQDDDGAIKVIGKVIVGYN